MQQPSQSAQQGQPDPDDGDRFGDYDDDAPGFQPTPLPNPLKLLQTGATVLSKAEAAGIRPFLIEAISGYTDYLDDVISKTNRAGAQAEIWSTLDAQEIATLVDGMLVIGQKQRHVALAIREVARTWTAVQAGIILFPRFLATVRFYSENGGIALW